MSIYLLWFYFPLPVVKRLVLRQGPLFFCFKCSCAEEGLHVTHAGADGKGTCGALGHIHNIEYVKNIPPVWLYNGGLFAFEDDTLQKQLYFGALFMLQG